MLPPVNHSYASHRIQTDLWPHQKGSGHSFSHLYTMETQKCSLGPLAVFFYYLSLKACIFESSYLFSTVTFMIIYITQLPEKCPMNGKAFCLRRPDKIHWQLYNQSLLPPCGHFIEAHRNWVGLASVREHWNMCIKINLSTTLALSRVYLGYSTI